MKMALLVAALLLSATPGCKAVYNALGPCFYGDPSASYFERQSKFDDEMKSYENYEQYGQRP